MIKVVPPALSLCLAFACSAMAHAAQFCSGIDDANPNAMMTGRIIGAGAAHFLAAVPSDCKPEEKGCPGYGHPFVRPGGRLAVWQSAEGLVCAEAATGGGSGRRFGWLPKARVQVDARPDPVPSRWWLGKWNFYTNSIVINRKGRALHARGEATSGRPDNPRFADFEGDATPKAGSVTFSEGRCIVKLTPFGAFLAVTDNGTCGPMTRLSGFYSRR